MGVGLEKSADFLDFLEFFNLEAFDLDAFDWAALDLLVDFDLE